MNIQQIRNATIIVEYGGKKILIDPMLGKKGCMQPFPFSRNQHLRNPLHELPLNGFRLGGRVIMNDEDVVKVAAAAPNAKLFVTHLEGVNHNSVTREREMVRKRAEVAGILNRVFIPEDGEKVENL